MFCGGIKTKDEISNSGILGNINTMEKAVSKQEGKWFPDAPQIKFC